MSAYFPTFAELTKEASNYKYEKCFDFSWLYRNAMQNYMRVIAFCSQYEEDRKMYRYKIISYLSTAYALLEVWKNTITTQHKEALEIEKVEVNLDHFEEFLHPETNNDLNIVEMVFWTNYAYEYSIKAKEQTKETIEGKDDVHDEMCENYICWVKTGIDLAQIAIIAFVARLGEYPNTDQPIVF